MKLISASCLLLAAISLSAQSRPNSRVTGVSAAISSAPPRVRSRVLDTYGRLPLAFEANQGQTDPQVKFVSRGTGYNLFLTATEAVLTLRKGSRQEHTSPGTKSSPLPENSAVLHMRLVGANAKADVFGQDELPGKSNYFIGNDPKKWHASVPQYARVRYADVYPGVDLVYYGNQREMEYDFVLQPGADPGVIRLGIEGASRLRVIEGDLVLSSPGGEVLLRRPNIYQELHGRIETIRGRYVLNSRNEVGFRVDSYDRAKALVIDPVLAYSSYLGGSGDDGSEGIAVDAAGNAYVTGGTASIDFPTANSVQSTNHGGVLDAFVTKFNADGTALVYSTYLGGNGNDLGTAITVDTSGNAYVTGRTMSTDFPMANAIQPTNHGGNFDTFVTKIDAEGAALVYSTYLGGSGGEESTAIAVDGAGKVYVTGESTSLDFPVANAFQPTNRGGMEAFVAKLDATGTAFVYSTYLGGTGDDGGLGVAADSAGNAYVSGFTLSSDFPTANALQSTNRGGQDAFVAKINAGGSALVYSTYLGGEGGEVASGIAVDEAGNAWVTGRTGSTNFPTANPIQPTNHGGNDAFVTKLNADDSAIVYSTYLGGTSYDEAFRIAVDTSGSAYITGDTYSVDFPIANAIQSTKGGFQAAFVTKLKADGSGLVYSTYLGGKVFNRKVVTGGYGIAADSAGSAYVTGVTSSKSFPTTLLAFQHSLNGYTDTFVTKIAGQTLASVSPPSLGFGQHLVGTTSKKRQAVLTNNGTNPLNIRRIYITGAHAGDFAETNTCGATLAPGGNCKIQVTFTPTAVGVRKGLLAISDSDPASPQAIKLSGSGQ
jgi:hypothetical protein